MVKNIQEKNRGKSNNVNKIQLSMLTIVCMMIMLVSFTAFLKIENNLHALLVLLTGMSLNIFIFINGLNQAKK